VTDKDIALALCKALQQLTVPLSKTDVIPLKVFLDSKEIVDGSNWKQAFVNALQHSCLFVPIVSEAALEPLRNPPTTKDKPDNVLLEYEVALKQQRAKRLAIMPIFVGKRMSGPASTSAARFDFESCGGHTFPEASSTTDPSSSIRTTISGIMANQGVFFSQLTLEDLLYYPKPGEQTPNGQFSVTDRTHKVFIT
jgi:hypothetical protein